MIMMMMMMMMMMTTFNRIIYFIEIICSNLVEADLVIFHNACSTHLYFDVHVTVIDSDLGRCMSCMSVHGSQVEYVGCRQDPFV